jgi:hypothetical protein
MSRWNSSTYSPTQTFYVELFYISLEGAIPFYHNFCAKTMAKWERHMLGTSKKQHDFAKIAQYPCLRRAAVPLWRAAARSPLRLTASVATVKNIRRIFPN